MFNLNQIIDGLIESLGFINSQNLLGKTEEGSKAYKGIANALCYLGNIKKGIKLLDPNIDYALMSVYETKKNNEITYWSDAHGWTSDTSWGSFIKVVKPGDDLPPEAMIDSVLVVHPNFHEELDDD